jgi:hypothetical protein
MHVMSETSAWLIERHVNGVAEWLCDESLCLQWTTVANDALKFGSEKTANFWIYNLKIEGISTEHLWCDSLLEEAKQRSRDLP